MGSQGLGLGLGLAVWAAVVFGDEGVEHVQRGVHRSNQVCAHRTAPHRTVSTTQTPEEEACKVTDRHVGTFKQRGRQAERQAGWAARQTDRQTGREAGRLG